MGAGEGALKPLRGRNSSFPGTLCPSLPAQPGFSPPLRFSPPLPEHPEHLFGSDHHQAEGQMSRDFDWAAHSHMASSMFIVQTGVYRSTELRSL